MKVTIDGSDVIASGVLLLRFLDHVAFEFSEDHVIGCTLRPTSESADDESRVFELAWIDHGKSSRLAAVSADVSSLWHLPMGTLDGRALSVRLQIDRIDDAFRVTYLWALGRGARP